MGPFIIGVLVGWLAEWVFFTFFVKGKKTTGDNSNTSALQTELTEKNIEIKTLQAKLADAEKAFDTTTGSASSTTPQNEAKETVATKASKDSNQKTTTKKPAVAKSAPKTSTKKPTAKTSTKIKTSAKPASKTSPKTSAPKKAAPKKATAKKPATKAKTKPTGDDFTLLSGIGPSMAATLNELGIDSFKKLAAMDDDILRDMLEASGARLNNNKEAMDTWNEQATLADKGDFENLKKMQEALKK
ncbi:hypothetical protein GQR58_010617 [Nymphon striatum]|nr:hypothetical protein GQR58_010617 [Nymphon striatum]